MQEFLSFMINAIVLASVGYFAIGFVLSIAPRPAVVQADAEELVQEFAELVAELEATIDVAAVTVEVEVPAQDWAELTAHQLRSECQVRGIKWRHAHGRDRHLCKGDMVAALAA